MNKQTRAAKGIVHVRVHNPAPRFTLGLPGERRKNRMATKTGRKANRKRSSRRGKKRNTASVRQSTALAPYRAPTRRSNPKRRHHPRRNPVRRSYARRSNPFGGKIAGLSIMDLAGGAVGLVLDGVLQLIVPASWLGIGLRGAGAVAMVKFLPKSIGPAAGLVAGASTLKSAADKAFGLSALVNTQVVRLIPAQAAAGGNGGGMAGVRGLPRPRAGYVY